MPNMNILHVYDNDFDRHIVDSLLDWILVNIIGVNLLQDFQLKLDTNYQFVIIIFDGSFPDESHWAPRLNIARVYNITQNCMSTVSLYFFMRNIR